MAVALVETGRKTQLIKDITDRAFVLYPEILMQFTIYDIPLGQLLQSSDVHVGIANPRNIFTITAELQDEITPFQQMQISYVAVDYPRVRLNLLGKTSVIPGKEQHVSVQWSEYDFGSDELDKVTVDFEGIGYRMSMIDDVFQWETASKPPDPSINIQPHYSKINGLSQWDIWYNGMPFRPAYSGFLSIPAQIHNPVH